MAKQQKPPHTFGGRKRPKGKPASTSWRLFRWIAVTVAGLVVALVWFEFTEPNLKFAGSIPLPAGVYQWRKDGPLHLISMTTSTPFRNWGLKAGHIRKVEIVPVALTPFPEQVKVNCDQAEITLLTKKEIRCDFLIWIDRARPPGKGGTLEFRTIFYDQAGREIWREETIKIIPT